MSFDLASLWYNNKKSIITFFLLPLSWLFSLIITLRRFLYHKGWFKTHYLSVPVIVVGNITVGGTGKTPLVIELANLLLAQGYRPGIVTRGVGGRRHVKPQRVSLHDDINDVGDEAILLTKNTVCPVVICIDRVAAGHYLLAEKLCDIIISDDGLQHYRLGRNIEIAVIDGKRGIGNNLLLPAGPLRESVSRLNSVDYVVVNGDLDKPDFLQKLAGINLTTMNYQPTELVSLQLEQVTQPLSVISQQVIHAVAAIGHPERFFHALKNYNCEIIPHAFTDHYVFEAGDLEFSDDHMIVMTEKDAVKCKNFPNERHWYLKAKVKLDEEFRSHLLTLLDQLK